MAEEKKGFFKRLVSGLAKTRDNIVAGFDSIFSGFSSIDEDFYEELEEILIMGDIGINATTSIIDNLKKEVSERHIKEPMECKQLLINEIKDQMRVDSTEYEFENRRSVVLVIGVNGVGKTTSVGKLAGKLKDQGKKVILAAADTFRAAAGEQLTEWANRAGVEIIGGQAGADPASVIYDAVAAAKARNADVLLCDTAGRLHNKKEPYGRTPQDLQDPGEGVSGCISGDTGSAGWYHRTECPCTGETICGGRKCQRYYPYQAGRNCQGRYCSCHPV